MAKKSRSKRFNPPRRFRRLRGKENCITQAECIDGEVSTDKPESADCSSQNTNPNCTAVTVGQQNHSFPQSSHSREDILTCRSRKENVDFDKSDNLSSTVSPNLTASTLWPIKKNTTVEVQEDGSLLPAESSSVKEALVENIEVPLINSHMTVSDDSQATEIVLALDSSPEEKFLFVENQDISQLVLHSDISLLELSSDVIFLESPADNPSAIQEVDNTKPPTTNSIVAVPPTVPNFCQLWQQVHTYVLGSNELPSHWQTKVENNVFHLMGLSTGLNKVVNRAIAIKADGTVTVNVHGKAVPRDHKLFWDKIRLLQQRLGDTPIVISAFIISIFKEVRDWAVCTGSVQNEVLSDKYPNCYFEEGFVNHRFKTTLRSTVCLLLVDPRALRCKRCTKLLRAIIDIKQSKAKIKDGTPNKNKPDNVLSTPETKSRTDSFRRVNRNSKLRDARRIAMAAIDRDGVQLDSSLSECLTEAIKGTKLTEFQQILIESQRNYAELKDKRSIRWHPAMIRFALNVKCGSSFGYNIIKRYLHLPDERTLFDYSHAVKTEEGIVPHFVESVHKKMDPLDPNSKYFILSFDEMYISQNLVYSKETGAMVGYCKLNEVEKEMRELEQALLYGSVDPTPPIAKAMLTFMVRGVFNSIQQVVASFGTNNLTSNVLYQHHWDVVEYLEICGMRICGCVSDGAGVNRSFIKMHEPVTKTASGVVFDTYNIYSSGRIYHFFADLPHLLKTLRNNFASKARNLTINNQVMPWLLIQYLYEDSVKNDFQKSYKLNAQCVFLNSYSQMKVSYAARVFSRTVANDLESRCLPNTSEVINFIRKVNDFFDILNGCSFTEATVKKNGNLAPYTSASDERLGVLDDFLEYLRNWKRQVSNLPLPPEEKNKMFISDPTYEGIEMTIRAFKSFIRTMLPVTDRLPEQQALVPATSELPQQQEKPQYIMARVANQDKLEKYFGLQRAHQGGSRHPNQAQFLSTANTMHVVKEVAGYVRGGNTERDELGSVPCISDPVPKRRKVARGLFFPTTPKV